MLRTLSSLAAPDTDTKVVAGERLLSEWRPRVASYWGHNPTFFPAKKPTFEAVFWTRYFELSFDAEATVELRECAGIGQLELREFCEAGGVLSRDRPSRKPNGLPDPSVH